MTKRLKQTLKQDGLLDASSKEFSLKFLSVMMYEHFVVSVVELIMFSRQQIILHTFQTTRVT